MAPIAEDEPVETTSDARPTPGKVAALMEAAIAAARAEGIAALPDIERKTFGVTRKLASLACHVASDSIAFFHRYLIAFRRVVALTRSIVIARWGNI